LQKASKTQFSKVLNEQTPDIKKLQVLNRKWDQLGQLGSKTIIFFLF
jgi:hypothetical protein